MTTLINCPDAARWKQLLDGALPENEQAELSAHLESCERCQQTVERLTAGHDSWEGAARELGAACPANSPALQNVIDDLRDRSPDAIERSAGSLELPAGFLEPSEDSKHLGKAAHYDVIETVGRGAMGIVLKAFDRKLQRVVAMKVMSPQFAANATARKRFAREARAAAAVCHEHVVTIHAVDEGGLVPYFVMQFVGGRSLQERIDQTGPLQVREILRIGMQAAEGLAAAHKQGLVHRDIKPANILLENGVERVKITDFGLARAVDDASLTQSGVIAGTPQYMAPEQARGEPIDHRADLFSLGCVMYTMCTGRAPFRGSTTMAVMKRVCDDAARPICEVNPEVPSWLAGIVSRLMAKNAAERYQSAAEVAQLLERCLAHLQHPQSVPLPAEVSSIDADAGACRSAAVDATMPAAVSVRTSRQGNLHTDQAAVVSRIPPEQYVTARRMVKGPAIGLAVTAVVNWLGLIASAFVWMYLATMQNHAAWIDVAPIVAGILFCGSGLMIWGALKMSRLESYGWAMAATIGAMFIGPGYLVGWPVGIWSLFVLTRPEVVHAFETPRAGRRGWMRLALIPAALLVLFGFYLADRGRIRDSHQQKADNLRQQQFAAKQQSELVTPVRETPQRAQEVEPGGSHAAEIDPAAHENLERLAKIAEDELSRTRKLFERQVVPPMEVAVAEINLRNAQIRLAESHGDRELVVKLLTEVVALREQSLETVKRLREKQVATDSEVGAYEKALLEDRLRLTNARNLSKGNR